MRQVPASGYTDSATALFGLPQPARRGSSSQAQNPLAFTLIEVLVVVAIIVLLAALLLPSLAAARVRAKLTICMANCKQIGTTIAEYQTESAGYVPVVFNDAAPPVGIFQGPTTNTPERTMLLSVALRNYDGRTRHMAKPQFDPETHWTSATRELYEATVMPEFYVCPFERGNGPKRDVYVGPSGALDLYELRGRFESTLISLWSQNAVRPVRDLEPEFAKLNWNRLQETANGVLSDPANNYLKNKHRRWTSSDVNKLGGASLSDAYVTACGAGEHMIQWGGNKVENRFSHRTAQGGGTNAIFADTHVQWVKGLRVGGL